MSKVPKLRFPEFEGEWEEKELENILEYERPDNYIVSDTNYSKVGIPVLTANKSFILGYTEENEGVFKDIPVIIFDDFTTDKKYVDFPFKVKSSAIKILKTKKDSLKFIYEAMSLIDFEATEHKRYYISAYQKIPLHIPSIAEQQKIADCLSSLDELIEARKEKIASLKAYKKGLLQQLFPQEVCNNYPPHPLIFSKLPKLRFAGFEGEWEEVKLGDVVKYENGKAFENNITEEGLFNVITLRSIDISGRLKDEHLKTNYNDNSLKKGDIVMVLSDVAHGDFLGLCAIIPTDDFVLNQRMGKLYKFKNVVNTFLCFYINNKQKEFKLLGQGSSQLNLSKQDILDVHFFLPSLDEQQKIADCLLSLDEKIATETEQVAQLQQHKKGLLQQLLV